MEAPGDQGLPEPWVLGVGATAKKEETQKVGWGCPRANSSHSALAEGLPRPRAQRYRQGPDGA